MARREEEERPKEERLEGKVISAGADGGKADLDGDLAVIAISLRCEGIVEGDEECEQEYDRGLRYRLEIKFSVDRLDSEISD